MIFMMRGHQYGHRTNDTHNHHLHQGYAHEELINIKPSRLDVYKMKQLEGEIDFLKEQNTNLREKIDELSRESQMDVFKMMIGGD